MMSSGDDISDVVNSFTTGYSVWKIMCEMGLELKRDKQFISHDRAEFFRVDITPSGFKGSLQRALGGMVAGSWLSDHLSDYTERIAQIDQQVN